jgi:23S rRNA (adenine2030-N6)-methyltransferase
MNYRHAFHAGNHADVLKHAVLLAALAPMLAKPAPLAAYDLCAGAGGYDLLGPEAERSPEWRAGIGRLLDWPDPPAVLAPLIAAGQAGRYPGSPRLLLDHLRPQDRLIAFELHPEEFAKLKHAIGGDKRAHLHARDGFTDARALAPPAERRGIVLLDPPYENRTELAQSVETLSGLIQRFRQGVYLWWRPIKAGLDLDAADAALTAHAKLEWLRIDLAITAPQASSRLVASSMLVLSPGYGVEAALAAVLPPLMARLNAGDGYFRLHRGGI